MQKQGIGKNNSKTDDGETRNYREIKKAGQHGMDKEDECHLS